MAPNSTVRVGPIIIPNSSEAQLVSDTFADFTPENWDTPHNIRFMGIDDALADGNQRYTIQLGQFVSEDSRFSNQVLPILSAINTDDETAGVAVNVGFGLFTSEGGSVGTVAYTLQTRPMRNVTIPTIVSDTPSEAIISGPSSLTFTPQNWNIAQIVRVTGQDDVFIGNGTFTITTGLTISEDPSYNGLSVPLASGTNVDNDEAGFTVISPTNLTTSEAGSAISFTVLINTQPTADVTISSLVASPNIEGTASPSSLTFTPNNWSTPQIVTVSGGNDFVVDGPQTYTVVSSTATSADLNYNGIVGPVFPSITNSDNDTPGFQLTLPGNSTISENGGNLLFQLRLQSQPPPGSTVTLVGISENNSVTTVNPSTIIFTNANWNINQNITVSTINNDIDEDTRTVTLSFGSVDTGGSADPIYNSLPPPVNFVFSVTDDDTAGFTISPSSGLLVSENGDPLTTTISVVLTSQPLSDVNFPTISSSNTSEITVSPSNLTFTSSNWNTPQLITLTSVLDGVDDTNQNLNIQFANTSSADSRYNNRTIASISATNVDSNQPIIELINLSGSSTFAENGAITRTLQVRLSARPDSNVTIGPIVSSDTSELVVLDSSGNPTTARSLTFTSNNSQTNNFTGNSSTSGWNVVQTITVRGVDDGFDDGNILVQLNFPTATGSAFYSGQRPTSSISGYNSTTGNLPFTINDNDTKGFTFSTNTINITEGGTSATFTLRLNASPCSTPSNLTICSSGSVTIPLSQEVFSLPDTQQFTFSPSSLTFTHANAFTPQTVTITPVNDPVDEINIRSFTLTMGAISATGTDYDGFNPNDVTINITDDDNANPKILFDLKAGSTYFTSESGLTATYTLRLASQPLQGNSVSVTVATSDATEGQILDGGPTVTSKLYLFDSTNWSTAVDVVIVGMGDALTDGNVTYQINTSATETGANPSWYNNFQGSTGTAASLLNYGLSEAKLTIITPISMVRAETASSFAVYILASAEPTSPVTIPISVNTSFPCRLFTAPNVDQFSLSTNTITIDASNWNSIQPSNTIIVTPLDDAVDDGNVECPIIIGMASSADVNFNGFDPYPSAIYPLVRMNDNDSAGFTTSGFTPTSVITSQSGAESEFYVRLNSQPTSDVTVNFGTTPGSLVSFLTAPLTFTPANYGTPQLVQIRGIDTADTTDLNYTINSSATSSEVGTGFSPSTLYNLLSPISIPGIHLFHIYDIVPCSDPNPLNACGISPNANGGLVTNPELITSESAGTSRFIVRLRARPSSPVSIPLSSSNTAEGFVSVTDLLFSTTDWNTFQSVVITGTDDAIQDGNQSYSINLGPLAGGGSGFSGEVLPNVLILNQDND